MARRATILLVEDSADDALLVCRAVQLTFSGIPVSVVRDGVEAVRYLKGEGMYSDRQAYPFPQVVLLDLKMPQMDGFEVLKWIRQDPGLKRLPVIVLTGSPVEEDTTRAYESGANSYIVKPGSFDQMVKTIKNLGDFWFNGSLLPDVSPET
jgi:CheY-like chemotaxis protein